MKLNITKINESWIIDRIKSEWIYHNSSTYTKYSRFANLIWIIAPWNISINKLSNFKNKKIIYSQYHIEDTSENSKEIEYLRRVEQYVDAFHVISLESKSILNNLTKKPIYYLPLWVNQNIWFHIPDKTKLRKSFCYRTMTI